MPDSPRHNLRDAARILLASSLSLIVCGMPAYSLDPVVCIDEGIFVPPAPAPDPIALGVPLAGEIYEGATPPGLEPSKPVLVFVQGLHGAASDWRDDTEYYGHNDMYDAAHAAGYKTFFVDLHDANGEARSSLTNGRLLKRQLLWITDYWGVDEVNVVAHSKGGPDSNFAAVMFGAPVNTLVSLSGAHWGSPLADLAQSSWFDWLADLLGFNDEGTRFLQTGCMALMRGRLDSRLINNQLSFYTAAATGWGPLASALEFGGLYLAGACPGGDNDGLVCVEHAKHPWGRDSQGAAIGDHRLVWDAGGPYFEADHDNIRQGNAFFDFFWPWEPDDCYVPIFTSIEPYVGTFHQPQAGPGAPANPTASPHRLLATLLRGGAIEPAGGGGSFPVEGGVSNIAVRLLLSDPGVEARLRDPNGKAYDFSPSRSVTGPMFRGAFATGIEIDSPPPGDWRLEVASARRGAFALVALLDGGLDLRLSITSDSEGRTLSVAGEGAHEFALEAGLRRVSTDLSVPRETPVLSSALGSLRIEPGRAGVHNVSLTVRGTAIDGTRFERNAVVSLPIDSAGAVRLPEVCE